MILAPTHEEVFTTIAKPSLISYKNLPQMWYQIQTKFRNEARPRGGVLRVRQFTMKDAYSFDASWEGLYESYKKQYKAYRNIFTRCGMNFFVVTAYSGAMGGSDSEEFMVETEVGEDSVVAQLAVDPWLTISRTPNGMRKPASILYSQQLYGG